MLMPLGLARTAKLNTKASPLEKDEELESNAVSQIPFLLQDKANCELGETYISTASFSPWITFCLLLSVWL